MSSSVLGLEMSGASGVVWVVFLSFLGGGEG